MAKVKVKLRALDLRGETVSTRWGLVRFDKDGLSELKLDEDEVHMLRAMKPFSWLADDHVPPKPPEPAAEAASPSTPPPAMPKPPVPPKPPEPVAPPVPPKPAAPAAPLAAHSDPLPSSAVVHPTPPKSSEPPTQK